MEYNSVIIKKGAFVKKDNSGIQIEILNKRPENCKIDTCRQLRINQNQIINENVFFGDFKAHPTII